MLADIIREIVEDEEKLFLFLGITMLIVLGGLSMITKMITAVAQERTKREIAAYIAEGTMSAEQGERLVKASRRNTCG